MADNIDVLDSHAATKTIATRDLTAQGGTGHAEKSWTLPGTYICTGSDPNVTVATSVVKSGVGLTIPANTTHMLLTVESGDVRFREDNVAPTSANGVLLTNGSMLELPIPATPAALQFIQSGSSAATLNISYRSYR